MRDPHVCARRTSLFPIQRPASSSVSKQDGGLVGCYVKWQSYRTTRNAVRQRLQSLYYSAQTHVKYSIVFLHSRISQYALDLRSLIDTLYSIALILSLEDVSRVNLSHRRVASMDVAWDSTFTVDDVIRFERRDRRHPASPQTIPFSYIVNVAIEHDCEQETTLASVSNWRSPR